MSTENHPKPEIDQQVIDQRIAVVEELMGRRHDEMSQSEVTPLRKLRVVEFTGAAQLVPVTVEGKQEKLPLLPLENDRTIDHLRRAVKPLDLLLSGKKDRTELKRDSRQHHAVRKGIVDKMADAREKRIFPAGNLPQKTRAHGLHRERKVS